MKARPVCGVASTTRSQPSSLLLPFFCMDAEAWLADADRGSKLCKARQGLTSSFAEVEVTKERLLAGRGLPAEEGASVSKL